MWATQIGKRVLTGIEAQLYREGLDRLFDNIHEFEEDDDEGNSPWTSVGVKVFDRLTRSQKIGILEHVSRALLLKSVSCPLQTAVAEGAIAAVYRTILIEIEIEIETKHKDFRKLVRKTCVAYDMKDLCPLIKCDDVEEWHWAIEALLERIFWDRDWEDEFITMDKPPEVTHVQQLMFGIHEDYYTALAPDPTPAQLKLIVKRLHRLLNRRKRSS